MDYVSHGIWSYILFHWIRRPWLAVMFGLLPDTASWAVYFLYGIFTGISFSRPALDEIPSWVFTLYGISHSLIIAGIVILIVFVILKRVPVYMYAWPFVIVVDLLTHTREFLPTPFLWPVSDWKFPGISWGTKRFMIINLILMAGFLICIFWKKNKNKKKKIRKKSRKKNRKKN